MLAIQTGSVLSDPNRMRMTSPILLFALSRRDGATILQQSHRL